MHEEEIIKTWANTHEQHYEDVTDHEFVLNKENMQGN